MKPKPKFKVGQIVECDGAGENSEVDRCHFDPCDGWEYHLKGEPRIMFTFEENLRLAHPSSRDTERH